MNSLTVLSPGLLTTVQDLGREGYGPLGVSASGAADSLSLRIGNRLVGNDENAAGLEMTLLGGEFQFSSNQLFAITGSDFGATLNGVSLSVNEAFDAEAGETLKLGPTRSGGARCYLCIRGGIATPEFLGSRSTHLLSGLGGFEGRALRKGDVLPIGSAKLSRRSSRVSARIPAKFAPHKTLRITEGPQWSTFSEVAKRQLFQQTFTVTEETNRMGIRLAGAALQLPGTGEMITEGVSLGAIQVPPGGHPIILFVEQQTTGGYPKIANVISADIPSLGQLRPRDEIRFEWVTMETAREAFIEQERFLASPELIKS